MTLRSVFAVAKAPRWSAALGLLLATAMPALAQCPLSFASTFSYAVGTNPISVAVGDFNADGRPDLAVANFNSANASILLGNANGTFLPAVNYVAGAGPVSVAVGDFNADGRPDVAVANSYSNNVSVLLNTGTGFPPPVIIQQPLSQIVPTRQNAVLTVAANGFGNTLTYQWRKNGVPIVNGGTIAGATSPTLTFTPTLLSDTAAYDVQVTGAAACIVGEQVTTSAAGILVVNNPCPADFNGDGFVTGEDLDEFVALFEAGC